MPRNPARYQYNPEHTVFVDRPKGFYGNSFRLIDHITALIEKFANAGYDITERSLLYALVSMRVLPDTTRATARKLSALITDARLGGFIAMDAVDDPERGLFERASWATPMHRLQDVAQDYVSRRWDFQTLYPEVFAEKNAILGYTWPTCRDLHVPLYSCKGYTSWPGLYDAAARYSHELNKGKLVVVFHLADHDPSGIGMTQFIASGLWVILRRWGNDGARPLTQSEFDEQKVQLFAYGKERMVVPTAYTGELVVERLGLNHDQTAGFPPVDIKEDSSAKKGDPRSPAYRQYMAKKLNTTDTDPQTALGWEIDAMVAVGEPTALGDLIRERIEGLRDDSAWTKSERAEAADRAKLHRLGWHWPVMARVLKHRPQWVVKAARNGGGSHDAGRGRPTARHR